MKDGIFGLSQYYTIKPGIGISVAAVPEGGPDGEGVPAEGGAGRALPPLAPEQLPLRVV